MARLPKGAFGFANVEVTDATEDYAALSLHGPSSFAVLQRMGLDGVAALKPFDIGHFPFMGGTLMVSRTGFTGDLGYELWIDPGLALPFWDALYAAGADFGIQPYGESATNMARLEAGFIMPYMEFNEALKTVNFEYDQTPFELDLGWLVDFKKPHFNGRAALLEQKRNGPKVLLTKLNIEGNKPAEESILYSDQSCSREIGYVTSAMWSPAVKANIALAMIDTAALKGEIWAEIYSNASCDITTKWRDALSKASLSGLQTAQGSPLQGWSDSVARQPTLFSWHRWFPQQQVSTERSLFANQRGSCRLP